MSAIEEGGLAFRLGEEDALDLALRIRDNLRSADLKVHSNKLDEILDYTILEDIVKNASAGTSDARQRIANLKGMFQDVSDEAKQHELDLLQVINRFSGRSAIQIITGHQSKGTEFDVVFFIGLEDDVLPDYRAHKNDEKLAEERRIFYVGLTRARKAAYLSSVANRPMRGGWVKTARPSRFIDHIPDEYFSEVPL